MSVHSLTRVPCFPHATFASHSCLGVSWRATVRCIATHGCQMKSAHSRGVLLGRDFVVTRWRKQSCRGFELNRRQQCGCKWIRQHHRLLSHGLSMQRQRWNQNTSRVETLPL